MKVIGRLKSPKQGYFEGSKSYEVSIGRGGVEHVNYKYPLKNGVGGAKSLCNADALRASSMLSYRLVSLQAI